jgi:hypothetical protein
LNDFVGIFQRQREQQPPKDIDSQRLATARKRLQENYKEAENGLVICFTLLQQQPITLFSRLLYDYHMTEMLILSVI